ncbi:exocyst complex component Sec3 [Brevipalpus obovatus]|uniref:exocyst complex component Sec3 n=1 Tax=Brevipalpus obovatus TaxID=246614 RepID=UPI003D9EDC63
MDSKSPGEPESLGDNEVFVALSAREEADLKHLIAESGLPAANAKILTEKYTKEVSSLDFRNIHDIMDSAARIESVLASIEDVIKETKEVAKLIDTSQSRLGNVRDIVLQVQEKENLYQIENENCRKLKDELESLITRLKFPPNQERYLFGDISSRDGIYDALSAANALTDCLHASIHPALNHLYAVQEQKSKLETIQSKFAERLYQYILKEYDSAITQYSENIMNSINPRDLSLPSHQIMHSILLPFSPLVKWAKSNCRGTYVKFVEGYVERVRVIYEAEIRAYFEIVRDKLSGSRNTLSSGDSNEKKRRVFNVVGSEGLRYNASFGTSSNPSDMADSISRSSDLSFTEWEEFDSCIEKMLTAIDPYCLMEQQFCIDFFEIEGSVVTHSGLGSSSGSGGHHRRNSSWTSQSASISVSPSPSNPSQSSSEMSEPKRSEALRQRMADIFFKLELEFSNFVAYYDRLDGLYSMYLLARLTQHVLSTQDAGSFLAKTYGTILIQVKRNFDKFMQAQRTSIEESKVPKKQKCGVFSFIKGFEQFSKQAESVFRGISARRTDIDRWYTSLMQTMFETVDRLSLEHPKTPSEIIRLENYHYLNNVLWTLKIQCLDNERKEAKKRYNESLKEYVAKYFGRPLEKLNIFFEGVQMKVSQGVKAEEVGYQLAYSKQELRKVIKDCSLKEVRKGLEEMYRKVEKHISESDSTLIQVLWRSMQEEFISQYKILQEMIERCYPDANISLSFTINDILQVFSDIAQSH